MPKKNLCLIIFLLILTLKVGLAAERENNLIPSPPKRLVQAWQLEPKIPTGWAEIDRKEAKVTNQKNLDVFVLMTDGKNDQIVWFEKMNRYWKMSIVESVPSEDHIKYGVNIKDLRLYIRGARILYGCDGSEAISYYDWDPKEKIFVQFVPFVD